MHACVPGAHRDPTSSAPHTLHGRVKERLLCDGRAVALTEVLDLHLRALLRELGRQPGVSYALSDRVPVSRAGNVAGRSALSVDRLAAHDDHARVVEEEARKFAPRVFLLALQQRLSADKFSLVKLHRESEPRLVGVMFGGHVCPPQPVTLLQPHAAEGPASCSDHAERPSRPVEYVPEAQAQVGGGIEFPAELADVGDPERHDGYLADVDAPCLKEPERLIGEVVGTQALHKLAGLWPPDPNAAGAAGDVPDLHRAVIGQRTLHPLDVPRSVEPELEVLRTDPRDGNVAPDPRLLVQHQGVGNAAYGFAELVRVELLQEAERPRAADLGLL